MKAAIEVMQKAEATSKGFDPLANQAMFQAVLKGITEIEQLKEEIRSLKLAPINESPLAIACRYKCIFNNGECRVEHVSGNRFKFINEYGHVEYAIWDHSSQEFSGASFSWGPHITFQRQELLHLQMVRQSGDENQGDNSSIENLRISVGQITRGRRMGPSLAKTADRRDQGQREVSSS